MFSGWEGIVVIVIAVSVGSRLPKIARNLGQAQQEQGVADGKRCIFERKLKPENSSPSPPA